jgi:hypothetical protein
MQWPEAIGRIMSANTKTREYPGWGASWWNQDKVKSGEISGKSCLVHGISASK